jgi:hypothetical protein
MQGCLKQMLKISILPSISNKQWNGKQEDYKILLFGDTYVVAKEFKATRLV